MLLQGKSLFALGHYWHPEHFLCAGTCGRELGEFAAFKRVADEDRPKVQLARELREAAAAAAGGGKPDAKADGKAESKSSGGALLPSTSAGRGSVLPPIAGAGERKSEDASAYCEFCYDDLFAVPCHGACASQPTLSVQALAEPGCCFGF